jgi:hypothetical protein
MVGTRGGSDFDKGEKPAILKMGFSTVTSVAEDINSDLRKEMLLRLSGRQIGFKQFLKRFALKREAEYYDRNSYVIICPTRCNGARGG